MKRMSYRGGVRRSLRSGLAVALSALLMLTACAPGGSAIDESETPLGATGEEVGGFVPEEQEANYIQTLDDGTVVYSDGVDVSAMDISVEATPETEEEMLTASAFGLTATPMAAEETLGGLIVSGGVKDTDYKLVGTTVQVLTSTPLTFRNANASASTNTNIQINAGVNAWITLNGVNIAGSTGSPINMITNIKSTSNGANATNGDQILNKTTLHLYLADGTSNVLNALSVANYPGLRCGEGSVLVVDDARANIDSAGNPVVPANGLIGADVTLKDGTQLKKGDALYKMDSANPGSLTCSGGDRSSGIGGGAYENSGIMTFEGGKIYGYGYQHTTQTDSIARTGAGIGGGINGSGTYMYFNGGEVTAYGAYHAAGIGAGYGNQTYVSGGAAPGDAIARKLNSISATVGGDIYINGGFIKSNGGSHGNAFGQGCVSNNKNHIIKVTGGTLLPTSPSDRKDIGGDQGYTIILGGSVRCASASKFQGIGGTAYNTQGITTWSDITAAGGSLSENDKVQMVTIDMSADINPTGDKNGGNNRIDYWELLVAGVPYNYGAPAQFDNGKLYLWLPKSATSQQITVNLKYRGESGSTINVEPLYRDAGAAGDTPLKRYVDFEMDKKYTDQLKKPYDGLPFDTYQIDVDHPLETPEKIGGTDDAPVHRMLTDGNAVTYKYQLFNEKNGSPIGAEIDTGKSMPSDTGVMKFTMTSTQYANTTGFKESYWGHRATGWCEITPVPAVLTLKSADWGNLDTKTGTFTPTTSADDQVGNRIRVTFNVRSAIGTAVTCKTPTGAVQLYIDDKKFGSPIPLIKEEVEKSPWSTYTVTEGAKTAEENTSAAIASAENRWTATVVYYMDPIHADGLLAPKPSKKIVAASKSDLDAATSTAEVFSAVVDNAMRATADDKAWAENTDMELDENQYKLTAEYLPDKNYVEGVEANPQNADAAATIIIPVNSDLGVTDEGGTKYVFEDVTDPAPDGTPADGTTKTTSVVKNYSDFHKKDAEGNETKEKDYFTLTVTSQSSMPMEWHSSDPAVADVMRDAAGNVIYDEGGNPRIQVNSCGPVTITMHQPGNAVFTEQTRIIEMNVIPDESLKPETEVRVLWENKTHPGMPAAPGDEIEYTVVGSNLTDGSAWQDVNLGDLLPKHMTVNPDSVELTKNFSSPDDLAGMTPEELAELPFVKDGTATVTTDADGNTVVKTNVGSIYGGQSTAMRFTAVVGDGLVDRASMEAEIPPTIPNTPAAEGSYGVKETEDLVPGENAGVPVPVDDTKVYPITADDKPQASVIPRDPVLEGAEADIYVNKEAKNLTRQGSITLPGDEVVYSITVGNKTPDTCLHWPVISDELPQGLVPVPGSFQLTRVDGSVVPVGDDVYAEAVGLVALYVDDLYGNESTTLTFKCTVTDKASRVENTAQVMGTTPSDKWKGENPDAIDTQSDDPIVPDPEAAKEILGGEVLPPADPENPQVTIGDVDPEGPLGKAKKADDPATPSPVQAGDIIKKFGEVTDPADPQDIADELDRIIKEKIAADPEATEVDIPVTILRPNPENPEELEEINIIVTVPITPEMKNPTTPTPDPTDPPKPGQPWTPDPSIPTGDYPWGDFDFPKYIEDNGVPQVHTEVPASPGTLLPSVDPKVGSVDGDLKTVKTAENLTNTDGKTYVGDRVLYTITVSDTREGTAWFDAIIRDDLPRGVEIDMATAKLVTALGVQVPVASDAYDPATRTLAVNVGDVPGGTSATLAFEATISEDALNNDIGNSATSYGKLPSEMDPDDLDPTNRPEPGSSFKPDDWDDYDQNHTGVSTPEPVYPTDDARNGVRPADQSPALQDAIDQGNGLGARAVPNDFGTRVTDGVGSYLKLAQTGDPLTLTITGLVVLALAAAAVIALRARHRRSE